MNLPHRLRVEHLDGSALGIHETRPRLSWWLPAGTMEQRAYEVELGDGRTARCESSDHVLVPWPFEPLRSQEAVSWRVRIWTDVGRIVVVRPCLVRDRTARGRRLAGEMDRATRTRTIPVRRTTGVRPPTRVRARRRARRHRATGPSVRHRARHLRDVPQRSTRRRPRADSGLHELPRQPSGTDLRRHRPPGRTARTIGRSCSATAGSAGVTASISGRTTTARPSRSSASSRSARSRWRPDPTGPRPPARSATPTSWPASSRIDVSTTARGSPVEIVDHDLGVLTSSPAPPVRRIETIRPRSVTRLSPTRQVVDLGQNITGWMHLGRSRPRRYRHHARARRGARPDRRHHARPPRRRRPGGATDRPGRSRRASPATRSNHATRSTASSTSRSTGTRPLDTR